MYNEAYFRARNQDRDRPALWFYERLARRWLQHGPVLDFGCGTGHMLRRLAHHFDVAGYDISPHALDAARKIVPGATLFSEYTQIPGEFFGGIVSLHVLEHIAQTELQEVLALWRRSLMLTGRVLCAIPDAGGAGARLAGKRWLGFGDPSHATLLGWPRWRELFLASGFSVCRIGTDGLWNLPYREGYGKLRDGLRFSVPTVIQFLSGRLLLPAGAGETAIFLLKKA